MPAECLNDRCRFFLWDSAASCPACGRPQSRAWIVGHDYALGWIAAVATTFTVVAIVMVAAGGIIRLAASVLMALALIALGVIGLVRSSRSAPPGLAGQPAWTLDARYGAAAERSSNWLRIWSDLYNLAAIDVARDADEQQLLDEALAMVVAAENAASAERCEFAAVYIANALERLHYLADQHETCDIAEWRAAWQRSLAVADNYLDTLWLDHGFARQARAELDTFRRSARRFELAHTIDAISFVGAHQYSFLPVRAREIVHFSAVDPTAPDHIDLQRRRLRVERDLFLD